MADKQVSWLTPSTPTVDDLTVSFDNADTSELKKTTWQAVRDLFKTYFDTIYQAILVSGTNIKTINGNSLLGSGDVTITASANIPVKDEGITITSAVSSFNFVGSGVTATNVGNDVTVTISSGGGSWDVVWPASSTDSVPALFSGTTGKLIKNSTPTGTGNPVLQTSPTLTTPVLGTPSSGTLTNCTGLPISGLVASTSTAIGVGTIELWHATDTTITRVSAGKIAVENVNVGTEWMLQNSQSAAYTLVLTDAGKHIYHPSADTTARTWTIPANSSVAFPIGTAVTFINDTSAGTLTISITTDTLVLAGAGTTGSRTLTANGIATAVKVTSTRWIISGVGLS